MSDAVTPMNRVRETTKKDVSTFWIVAAFFKSLCLMDTILALKLT